MTVLTLVITVIRVHGTSASDSNNHDININGSATGTTNHVTTSLNINITNTRFSNKLAVGCRQTTPGS